MMDAVAVAILALGSAYLAINHKTYALRIMFLEFFLALAALVFYGFSVGAGAADAVSVWYMYVSWIMFGLVIALYLLSIFSDVIEHALGLKIRK